MTDREGVNVMAIEQAIFTCCRARREMGTTGFGYYSVTAGMDDLRKNSQELSMLSSSYSAPRNQELWWSSSPDDAVRNASEKAAIAERHPISFGYRLIDIGGTEKAVFTYGKNLGRDIQGSRPGNIMVNTVAADLSDVEAYPFEYFDSPEIFVGYDRDFFVNSPDTPAPDLDRPNSLTVGGSITREMVEDFLTQDSKRAELLVSMLQFVLDYNDPDYVTRQVMICDRKENIILWTAALSLCFPREIAKRFSFCTYSFLGSADSGSVSIERTMLCGVYSASANGDPEDRRATNYDFDLEAERIENALFDFERGFFTEAEPRCPSFMMILRSAFMGGYEQLASYHRFIIEETSCREIGNDLARGCCYYFIQKSKNQVSLSYLSDAADFAKKYMSAAALKNLLETAYACTLEQGEISGYFADIMSLSKSCIDIGACDKSYVYGVCLGFLKNAFLTLSLSRNEYLEAKQGIKEIFDGCGDSFERAFADLLTAQEQTGILSGSTKKWILLELAELLCRRAADIGGIDCLCSNGSDAVLFRTALGMAIGSEENNRDELIAVFGDMFPDDAQKLGFADALMTELGESSPAYNDLIGYIAALCADGANEAAAEFAADKPYMRQFFAACTSRLISNGSFDRAASVYGAMAADKLGSAYSKYLTDMIAAMLALSDGGESENNYTAAANVYRTFEFAAKKNALPGTADSICEAFAKAAVHSGAWYDLSSELGDMLLGLNEGSGSDFFKTDSRARNMLVMYCAASEKSSCESVGTLDCSVISTKDSPAVCALLADAFAKRCIDCGSALGERDRLFIDSSAPDSQKLLETTLSTVFSYILSSAPKELRAKLAAELLALMSVYCGTDLKSKGGEIYDSKVKTDDVIACFDSQEINGFVRDCGGSTIAKMTAEISEGFEAKKQGGVFGRLRSRFGRGKNG